MNLYGLHAVGAHEKEYNMLTKEQKNEYKKLVANLPEGMRIAPDGNGWYKYVSGCVPPITAEDYDTAMEEHIRKACIDRGYTTREPDVYLNSSNEVWKQDAQDFIAFRDAVMEYGLSVINHYKATGEAPALDEFIAGLPLITWTY